ncbi:hypothetical protein GGS24DRAFT_438740 [Hypoxylon argillaceum]|nr:hypothetical protein GGS24DRAFT_438740 [Hypoxylon argillaceum]
MSLHRFDSLDLKYDQAYLGLLSTFSALIGIIARCVPSFAAIYVGMQQQNKEFGKARCMFPPNSNGASHNCLSPNVARPSVTDGNTNLESQEYGKPEKSLA